MYKHLAIALAFPLCVASVHAAPVWSESFDDVSALAAQGWATANLSEPLGPNGQDGWFQGNTIVFDAASGNPNAYIAANYNSADFGGTVSNWLFTPVLTLGEGALLSFDFRGPFERPYFDQLQVYFSRNGASTDVGDTAYSVGDFVLLQSFTTLGQTTSAWRTQTLDLSALADATGRLGFRYTGWADDANYLGLDDVAVTSATVAQVPEPASLALLAAGLLGLAVMRRRLRPLTARGARRAWPSRPCARA